MLQTERRYDIDWLRVIAIGLLIVYHIAIIFQPWGVFIGFIQSTETSDALWKPMALINIWRIPLLFFVSGMGVCFALRRRDWKKLLADRAKRILLPLVFGSLAIVPIHEYIFQLYYEQDIFYNPSVGHLWFLANICIYVLQMLGFAFMKKDYDYKFFNVTRNMLKKPYMIYVFIIPFILEAEITSPDHYATFVENGHGFLIGMFAFFFGFYFAALGKEFWNAIDKVKFFSLIIAVGLYFVRLFIYELQAPNYLTAIEAVNWIYAVFGFGHKYLNKPSKLLSYFSESVYPIYIIHMIFLFWGAYLILPLELSVWQSLLSIVVFTFICCYISFEVLRRINIIRPLFGMKAKSSFKTEVSK